MQLDNLLPALRLAAREDGHTAAVLSAARQCDAVGAIRRCGEWRMPTGAVDLVVWWRDTWAVFEVDWRSTKWESIVKARAAGAPLAFFILRHPSPFFGKSLERLRAILPAASGREFVVTREEWYESPGML